MNISLIAAVAKNNVIGCSNKLPWNLPADMAKFKELTTNQTILMGKNTFLSIGKALPNRLNVVISRTLARGNGVLIIPSLYDALEYLEDVVGDKELFVIGGSQIYQQTIPIANKLYITWVDKVIPNGDSFFPAVTTEWECVSSDRLDLVCTHQVYTR